MSIVTFKIDMRSLVSYLLTFQIYNLMLKIRVKTVCSYKILKCNLFYSGVLKGNITAFIHRNH